MQLVDFLYLSLIRKAGDMPVFFVPLVYSFKIIIDIKRALNYNDSQLMIINPTN